jgi:hypothetical protein
LTEAYRDLTLNYPQLVSKTTVNWALKIGLALGQSGESKIMQARNLKKKNSKSLDLAFGLLCAQALKNNQISLKTMAFESIQTTKNLGKT